MSQTTDPQPARRRPDVAALVIAAGLAILGAVVAWDASRLGAGGAYARIGPQTIPYAIAVCLGLLAIWTAVEAVRGDFPEREPQELRPLVWIVGGLLAQLLVIRFAGFSIATALLFACTARGLGSRVPLPVAFAIGLVVATLIWFVFARLLSLTLPAGPLEHLIVDFLTPGPAAAGA